MAADSGDAVPSALETGFAKEKPDADEPKGDDEDADEPKGLNAPVLLALPNPPVAPPLPNGLPLPNALAPPPNAPVPLPLPNENELACSSVAL